jgi:multisubunit Na+/H+ antiporter MnhG subunit
MIFVFKEKRQFFAGTLIIKRAPDLVQRIDADQQSDRIGLIFSTLGSLFIIFYFMC